MPRVPSLLVVAAMLLGALSGQTSPVAASEGDSPIPVLAYYYIWFEEGSWERAKSDYPLLGRYGSDDSEIMRQHVRWAKEAGIDGFIVSWKSTLVLDRRLEQLIAVASEESFKLAIIYQGLDFHRDPQPIERVAADLDHFLHEYAGDPVFDLFGGPPLVVWSGTWEYTAEEIGRVAGTRSQRSGCSWTSELTPVCVQLLSSERNVEGVRRLAGLVDGNAYYWSSVNPQTFPGYPEKLAAMSEAVKETGGLWIAPAAPGFDATMLGGSTTVERHDGDTLRAQLDAAYASSPDAIGLISWNEFSENSHVEPSERYGSVALDTLADVLGGSPPMIRELDSSQPDVPSASRPEDEALGRVLALLLLASLVGLGSVAIVRRGRHVAAPQGPG